MIKKLWFKRLKTFFIVVLLIAFFVQGIAGCSKAPDPKPATPATPAAPQETKDVGPDVIKIGYAVSLTGPFAMGAAITSVPNYKLWIHKINENGGIYLPKYDRIIPIEVIEYDDRSETETLIRATERLIFEDKVDIILPPWGSGMNMAVAPLLSENKFPTLPGPMGSMRVKRAGGHMFPYLFGMMPQPDDVMNAILELLIHHREQGNIGNKVAAVFVNDLYGVEHSQEFIPFLAANGFEVVYYSGYPGSIKDFTPILSEIKALKPDAFVAMSYPADSFLLTEQSKSVGFNPAIFYIAIGGHYPSFRDSFGVDTVEGILSGGTLHPDLPYPEAAKYFQDMRDIVGLEVPTWGEPSGYVGLQVLLEAIQRVGSIDGPADREKIRNVIATEEFDTLYGRARFKGNFFGPYPAHLAQWQNGVHELVWPLENATADLIIPKPNWP